MGILKLWDFLRRYAPAAMQKVGEHTLKGKRLGVDSTLLMFQLAQVVESLDLLPRAFVDLAMFLTQSQGAQCFFVFDGEHKDVVKAPAHAKRGKAAEKQQKREQKLRDNGQVEEADKLRRRVERIPQRSHTRAIQQQLQSIGAGVRVFEAFGEADPLLAQLHAQGYLDAIVSEDGDFLAYDTDIQLIRGVCRRRLTLWKRSDIILHLQKCEALQAKLSAPCKIQQFSSQHLITMCILAGCDYTEKLKDVGPIRAYCMAQELHAVKRKRGRIGTRHSLPASFVTQAKAAERTFRMKHVVPLWTEAMELCQELGENQGPVEKKVCVHHERHPSPLATPVADLGHASNREESASADGSGGGLGRKVLETTGGADLALL